MKAFFSENGDPAGIFCIGYNITEYIDTRSRLADATSVIAEKDDQLNEIGFMQSHVIRKPLANIMGLASILEHMEMDSNQRNINEMMISSAKELDMVIRQITIKTGGTDS
jgi:signal transduction histidine kinase